MRPYLAKSAIPCVMFLCTILAATSSAMGQLGPPNDNCVNVVPFPLVRDVPAVFNGNNTGATNDCPSFPGGHVWEAVILPAGSSILNLQYCGSANSNNGGFFGNAWLNLANGCPCTSFTAGASFSFSCNDGNVEMTWTGLTPGNTYYYPVLLDALNNAIGPYTLTFTAGNPPPGPDNDNCVDRVFIEQDVPTDFDTTFATTDGPPAGLPCTGGTGPVNDIWFNWDSGFTGEVDVTVCEELGGSATFDTVIVVYDGCSCGPLPPVLGCNDDDQANACGTGGGGFHSTVNVPVVAGNCYKIQVGGFSGSAGGPGTLLISKRVPPPSEGACCFPDGSCVDGLIEADCIVLGGAFQGGGSNCVDANCPGPCPKDFEVLAPGVFNGTTCGAGNDIDLRASEDHSYTVTIPNDGNWTFSLCGSDFDTYIFLGTECGLGDIASNDDFCGLQSQVSADLTAGLYWVTIEAFGSAQCGDYILEITKPVGPNNDNCADRRPAFQGKTPFDNTGASTDGPQCDGNMTGDVWFNYIATETGTVDIDTCQSIDFPSLGDTVLTVYDGCDPCPVDCTTELASDDDGCASPTTFASTVKIPVVAGNCYKIQVGGFNGTQGAGILTITKQAAGGACCLKDGTCVAAAAEADCDAQGGTFQGGGTDCADVICPPANDNCDNRLPIFNGATPFDTVGASTDGPGVPCTPIGPVNDIWYNYNADFTGDLNVTTCEELGGSANFDTVLVVYDGCVCDPLSPLLGCNDDDPNNFCGSGAGGFHSTVVVPVVAGNCYKIRLGGFSGGASGTGVLNIFKKVQPGASLDIKPGSCPNSFNRNSNGVLPVALVGSADFDVKDVDLDSLLLVRKDDPLGGSVAPNEGPPGPHSEFEDVATPFAGDPQCDCHDLEGDGIQDLMMHFRSQQVVDALGLDAFSPGALVSLTLIGTLLDGTPFEADDCVRLVPPGTGGGLLAVGSNAPGAWLDVSPLDLTLDGGGFANFERTFPQTTVVTLTAPRMYLGWRFVGWSVGPTGSTQDGLQPGQGGGLYSGSSIELTIQGHLQHIEAIYRPVILDTLEEH